MSRPGRFAPSIATLTIALVFTSIAGNGQAADATPPTGWQATRSGAEARPRAAAAPEWSSIRPGVTGTVKPAAPSSARPLATAKSEPTWSRPSTSKPTATIVQNTPLQSNAPRWVLPGQRPIAASTATPQAKQAPREPKALAPPADAKNIASATPPSNRARQQATSTTNAPSTSSRAVKQASAVTASRQGSATRNQSPHRNRVANKQRAASSKRSSYTARLRDAVNVTMQGSETWAAFEEDLPMPNGDRGEVIRENVRMMPSEGEIIHEDGYETMGPGFGDGYSECSDGTCAAPGCGDGCEPGCECEPTCGCGAQDDLFCVGWGDNDSCHTVRFRLPKWQELALFGGVQGFKGPYDRRRDSGNFGFHEGVNAGFKMPFSTLGYQIGYRAVHSQLHGDKDTDIADPHTQQFVTAGLFHRVQDGMQGGVAWDMLRDERWGAVDFHQIRTELSFVDCGCHELGFAGTFHLNEHELELDDEEEEDEDELESMVWQASDQYLLFYRFHGKRGGEGRFYAGFNDNDDGILGSDMILPVNDRWSIQTGFTYLIPDDEAGDDGAANEAWNIGLGLTWHYGCRARACHSSCYRPLFNVADNGSLIVDGRPGPSEENDAE